MPIYLTTQEAAQAMGMDTDAVRRMCSQGQLKGAFRKGDRGAWIIPESAVSEWLAKRQPVTSIDDTPGVAPGGDVITVSGIHGSNVAAGRGAQVQVSSGVGAEELARLFAEIYRQIEARPPDPNVDREEVASAVKNIEKEVQKGEAANPNKVERWLRYLASIAPDILEVTVASLTSPAAGIAAVIRKVAAKAGADASAGASSSASPETG